MAKFVYEGHRVTSISPGHGSKKNRDIPYSCIDDNSGSTGDTAVTFAYSMGFSTMADRMVWPSSLLRDWK